MVATAGMAGASIVRASEGHTNLAHLSHQRHWKAERGEHGQGSDCFGRGGDDLIIEVPAGTLVRDRDRGNLLRDLKEPGDQLVVARGGKGGHGNTHFKSSTNRAPRQVRKGSSWRRTLDHHGAQGHRRRRPDRACPTPVSQRSFHVSLAPIPRSPIIRSRRNIPIWGPWWRPSIISSWRIFPV